MAPIRAEIVQGVQDMAVTIEDVLARRTGLEFFSWRAAQEAAPVAGAILAEHLGWSADETRAAIGQYVGKITRYLRTAGLAAEPSRSSYA